MAAVAVQWSAAYSDTTGILTVTYASGGFSAVTININSITIRASNGNTSMIEIGVDSPFTVLKFANCTSPLFNGTRDDLIEQLNLLFFKRDVIHEGAANAGTVVEGVTFNDGTMSAVTVDSTVYTPASSAPTATSGRFYIDDGTNRDTTRVGPRFYDGAAFRDLPSYDQGSFVPTLTIGTGTVTLSSSPTSLISWVRIGNLVQLSGMLTVSSVSSPSGTVTLGTLPFRGTNAGANHFTPVQFYGSNMVSLSANLVFGRMNVTATTLIMIVASTGTGGFATLGGDQFDNTVIMYLQGCYITDTI